MNFIISIIRTLFRHRWLILIGTSIFTLLVIYYTRHMQGGYDVKATSSAERDQTCRTAGQRYPAFICPSTYPGKSRQRKRWSHPIQLQLHLQSFKK